MCSRVLSRSSQDSSVPTKQQKQLQQASAKQTLTRRPRARDDGAAAGRRDEGRPLALAQVLGVRVAGTSYTLVAGTVACGFVVGIPLHALGMPTTFTECFSDSVIQTLTLVTD